MPAAVIFDIDGTLIDTVDLHARAWQEAFAHYGYDVPFDRIRSQIGKGSDQLLPALLPQDASDRFEEIDEHRGDHYKRHYLPQVRAFPGVRELFERLRDRGLRIVLASSAKGDELEKYVEVMGVRDLIESSTSSDDAERSKPHPDIFQAALDKLGPGDPKDVIVVGDTPYDAEAAARIGLSTVGLTCGGWSEESLREAGCIAIYSDPADLLDHLDASPLARPS